MLLMPRALAQGARNDIPQRALTLGGLALRESLTPR